MSARADVNEDVAPVGGTVGIRPVYQSSPRLRAIPSLPGRCAIALLLAATALTACGSPEDDVSAPTSPGHSTATAPPTSPPGRSCSASGMSAESRSGLPSAVARIRIEIVEAATACDYERLEELAEGGGSRFTFSFGGGDDPAGHWRAGEEGGGEPLRHLVAVLNLAHSTVAGVDPAQFVWPSAFAYEDWDDVPPEDRAALAQLYSNEELRRFEQFGSYLGHRVGITAAGDWLFFVAGD